MRGHLNDGGSAAGKRAATAALLLFLLAACSLSTGANARQPHRHRRDAAADLEAGLSHRASKVAEGNRTSLPEERAGPPNALGLALEPPAPSLTARMGDNYYGDERAPIPWAGSSRAAALGTGAGGGGASAAPTGSPRPETQLPAPTSSIKVVHSNGSTTTSAAATTKGPSTHKKRKAASKKAKAKKRERAIRRLSKLGRKLHEQASSVILVNGRKFDQVESASCVDDKFYRLLSRDLAQVVPHRHLDTYDTYYDYNYAKAVAAVVDAPKLDLGQMVHSEDKGEVLLNGLEELEKFWNITKTVYHQLKAKHHNRVRSEVAVHRWLYERLEGLKSLLMMGEESLVALNNQVRKLNKAPREQDLQQSLCSCITSRSGMTVIGIMNELFVDRNASARLKDLEQARRLGLEMAEDTASYCAYWYGDTIRTQALMKEKHIQGMVSYIARDKNIMKNLQKHYQINRTIITTTTSFVTNRDGNQVSEVKTKILTQLIDMTDMWLPNMADWIRGKFNLQANASASASASVSLQAPNSTTSLKLPHLKIKLGGKLNLGGKLVGKLKKHKKNKRKKKKEARSRRSLESIVPLHPDDPNSHLDSSVIKRVNGTLVKLDSQQTTKKPAAVTAAKDAAKKPLKESKFEADISKYGEKCAKKGFSVLVSVAYDQSTLMYNSTRISLDHEYIRALESSFSSSFKRLWRRKRNQWSRHMTLVESAPPKKKENNGTDEKRQVVAPTAAPQMLLRSVDEELSDQFEAVGSSYERGMKLGYMVGRFVGEKAARQWPDPAELNTFTYDSLFLAGVANGYNESATRALEQRIVTETTKRIAFTEASRQVFAKTLASAYVNGAQTVPQWGVLHGQRAVAKQAAKEGAKVGYDASVRAASEFGPKAHKFFLTHRMQRALSAPYKLGAMAAQKTENATTTSSKAPAGAAAANTTTTTTTAKPPAPGVSREIDQVQLEIEVYRSVSREATKCGRQTGLVMGALMGLVVTPEAFEAFARFRGSLEALENEFNHFRLGALRGYQFGEAAAYLNYTATLNQNLGAMKNESGTRSAHARDQENKRNWARLQSTTSTTSTAKPTGSGRAEEAHFLVDDEELDRTLVKTDNVFQFMIVNYGPNLVANHSSRSMLKIRSEAPDESVLQQIQAEAQDYLVANSSALVGAPVSSSSAQPLNGTSGAHEGARRGASLRKQRRRGRRGHRKPRVGSRIREEGNERANELAAATATAGERGVNNSTTLAASLKPPSNSTTARPLNVASMNETEVDELETLFGRQRVVGQLEGYLVANGTGGQRRPIKLNILDLGPWLELEEAELEPNGTQQLVPPTIKPLLLLEGQKHPKREEKFDKVFIKLQVPAEAAAAQRANKHSDPLADFLNAGQLDDGDGYMSGSFAPKWRPQVLANGCAQVSDLAAEVGLLDEWMRAIARAGNVTRRPSKAGG